MCSTTAPLQHCCSRAFFGGRVFLFCWKTSTSNRRRLPFKCRWLPFKCRPIVCLNDELLAGRLMFFFALPSGRTYNDLSQYPVFPWVLQDYTSETLDLSDPKVYRDLSTPMGWLGSPARRQMVQNRYKSLVEAGQEPYHYGSHYSTAGFVLWYLMRLEPFTTGALLLQGGKFDHADRMFDAVARTFNSCTSGV